jgi:hypothetical protein
MTRLTRVVNGKAITVALIAAMLALVGSVAFTQRSQREDSHRARLQLCGAENASRMAMRRILELAQALGEERERSAREAKRAAAFYRQAFALIEPLDCAKVAEG